MEGRDDQNGEQHGPGKNHQQVLINGVGDVFQYLRQTCYGDRICVSKLGWAVIDDLLKMVEQGGEVLPVTGDRWVMMHANHYGRGIPYAIAVHIVGVVSIAIAVDGWIHVIGVLDEGIKRAV